MGPLHRTSAAPRASGFTLIEIVVVMLILAIVIAMASAITRGVSAGQKRSLTATRMATVDAALVQFVSQQKRLPCPADGTLVSSNVNAGIEGGRSAATGCTGTLQDGVVPWRALGLTETDATDGWDRRLTYRLDPRLGADNGMNMSWCDPAGTGPAIGATSACNETSPPGPCSSAALANCTPPLSFLAGKGLMVKNLAAVILMDPSATNPHTGAAYVIISPGESGGGGYLNSGQLSTSSVGDGTEETNRNYASVGYVATPGVTYYVDDSLSDAAGVNHFDDVVLRPSVMSVATKAGLGPRAH
jgi:prepilin-type N-terminal cleavage/methylation domain-containing protein